MRPVFGVIQTPTRASVTIYQSAASNFFLRAALACAMPAHASVLVVRRAPQHRQSSETLSCQIVKLAHLTFLFESRLTKVRTPTALELAFYRGGRAHRRASIRTNPPICGKRVRNTSMSMSKSSAFGSMRRKLAHATSLAKSAESGLAAAATLLLAYLEAFLASVTSFWRSWHALLLPCPGPQALS